MKIIHYFLICCLSFPAVSMAQDQESMDQRLVDVYGMDEVKRMKKNNPHWYNYQLYFLDHSFYITELPMEKQEDFTDISEMKLNEKFIVNNPGYVWKKGDWDNFNPLAFNFKRERHARTYYKIPESGELLVFYAMDEFSEALNASKNNNE